MASVVAVRYSPRLLDISSLTVEKVLSIRPSGSEVAAKV